MSRAAKATKTKADADVLPKKDQLYKFILEFSKKHLRFPTTPEMCKEMDDISDTRLYVHIDTLVEDGRLERLVPRRYGLGITAYSPNRKK